jgi:hypothetical protein
LAAGWLIMSITIKNSAVKKDILAEIRGQTKKLLFSIAKDPQVEQEIFELIDRRIRNAPEISSLLTGELKRVFPGVENVYDIVDGIVNILKAATKIRSFTNLIKVIIEKNDFADIIALNGGSYEALSGVKIDWLEWLLTRGDDVILFDDLENFTFAGESFSIPIGQLGDESIRIPPQFSGTEDNNFIIRSFAGAEEEIANILLNSLQRLM